MSEKEFHKSNACKQESSESKDNLKELLKKSLLLNMDIFSSEFEDEYEYEKIESQLQLERKTKIETKIKAKKVETEKIIVKAEEFEREYEEDEFIKELANRELEIDFEKDDFILNIEESDIEQKENFKLFPKINIKIDRPERKNKAIKKIKTSKTRVKENLSVDTNSKNIKIKKTRQDTVKDKEEFFSIKEMDPKKVKAKEKDRETEKRKKSQVKIEERFDINKNFGDIELKKMEKAEDKENLFDINQIDSKEIKAKAISSSKFSVQRLIRDEDMFNIDLNQNKDRGLLSKIKKESIYNSFNEEEKFSSRAKNNLKIEGL